MGSRSGLRLPAAVLAFCATVVAASTANAATILFEGTLDPATNSNLTYWDQFAVSYVAPLAGADADMAFNVAVHTFSVTTAGSVTFASNGYGAGGFDSVVSVFEGTGGTAAYQHHEYSPFMPGDFSFDLGLGVGDYTVAVSMFLNEPCASGPCFFMGTFDDGFTNLVNFDPIAPNPLFYSVQVTTPDAPIPEPASLVLVGIGLSALRRRVRRAKGDCR